MQSVVILGKRSISLRLLADGTPSVLLQPLHYTFLMVEMFATKTNYFLPLFKLAVTDCAQILLCRILAFVIDLLEFT
jgi:hypothetical protein